MSSLPPRIRQRHADMTRRAILDVARELFLRDGYANTPIRRLAEQAGVAVPTIYATFGSKPAVLMGLLDRLDNELIEPIARQLMQTEEPAEVLGLVARLERAGRESAGDVLRLVMQAAASEPEVEQVWQEGLDRHREGIDRVCGRLAAGGHLRTGLTLEDAIAATLALTSMEAYDELVNHRGWSHDRYEAWLATALRSALLDEAAPSRGLHRSSNV